LARWNGAHPEGERDGFARGGAGKVTGDLGW
jgi:hypothetical protein